jgi:Tol biopolymer transport system component
MIKEATIVGALVAFAAAAGAAVWGESARASFPGEPGRIAFMSNRDGDLDIYTMKQNGQDVVQLTNDPAADQFPSWSSDGSKIAFTRTVAGKLAIVVMNADGSGQTQVT